MSDVKPALSEEGPVAWLWHFEDVFAVFPMLTFAKKHREKRGGVGEIEPLFLATFAPAFTWEDVDRLRELEYMNLDRHEDGVTIESIADRIEALLPPRETE